MQKIGILGYGEVGSAIAALYRGRDYKLCIKDEGKNIDDDFIGINVLNVCIPYSDTFESIVRCIIQKYEPGLVIIHSSVLPGTSENIRTSIRSEQPVEMIIVHSPIRGNHPDLYHSLKTFVKYIGALNHAHYITARHHFSKLDINCEYAGSTRTTELAKLLCTTYYGLCIAWHEEMQRICNEFKVSFEDTVTNWNRTYNDGYTQVGMTEVIRPVLYPPGGKIGGHCVISNAELLKQVTDSSFLDLILKLK